MSSFTSLDQKGLLSARFFIGDFTFEKSPFTMVEKLGCCRRIDQLANDTTQNPRSLEFKKTAALLGMGEHHAPVGKVHS